MIWDRLCTGKGNGGLDKKVSERASSLWILDDTER